MNKINLCMPSLFQIFVSCDLAVCFLTFKFILPKPFILGQNKML